MELKFHDLTEPVKAKKILADLISNIQRLCMFFTNFQYFDDKKCRHQKSYKSMGDNSYIFQNRIIAFHFEFQSIRFNGKVRDGL